jgi:hypothetical protein
LLEPHPARPKEAASISKPTAGALRMRGLYRIRRLSRRSGIAGFRKRANGVYTSLFFTSRGEKRAAEPGRLQPRPLTWSPSKLRVLRVNSRFFACRCEARSVRCAPRSSRSLYANRKPKGHHHRLHAHRRRR